MKKIKSVKLAKDWRTQYYYCPAGTELKLRENLWTKDNKLIFTESEIRNCQTGLFKVETENEFFDSEIPSKEILDRGFVISSRGEICRGSEYCNVENIFLMGNWYATREEAEKEAKFRKAKFYLNKLRQKCNLENNIGYNYIFDKDLRIVDALFNQDFKFTSKASIEQFQEQCKPEMLELLKEMILKNKI